MLAAFASVAGASSVDASAAGANASASGPTDLARLQALIKELEPAAPVQAPQPNMSQLKSALLVEDGPRELTLKSGAPTPQSFPNAEAEGNVMVFDEAEASVERALRRLNPSPGALPANFYNIPVTSNNKFCKMCSQFYNGALDTPGASMCTKVEQPSGKTLCYTNHNGCPTDMTAYTCTDNPSPPPPPNTDCHPARVLQYASEKLEVEKLMAELLMLKMMEQDLTLALIQSAERNPTCACAPVDKLASFL
jgi:hypothetical protein